MEKRKFINPSDIDDPAYAPLKAQISNELKNTISKMKLRESDEGTITIKINLSMTEASVPYKNYDVEKLMVDWKLTGQIVEKSQSDGNLLNADQYYLEFDEDGKPVMQRIQDAQHEIDEYL